MSGTDLVVAVLAIIAGSLLKSISGLGLPLVTIPAISYVADIETAVAVTSVPNIALNGALAWRERASWSAARDLPVLGLAGFVGAIGGTLALVSVPDSVLVVLLLVVVSGYAMIYFASPDFRIDPGLGRRLAPGVGLVGGAMQGAVGISGPIVGSWIHAYRLPRSAHILSVTTLFAMAGLAQIPALTANGAMDGLWRLSTVACVPALATIPAGTRLRDAISSVTFDRIVVVTLVASTLGLALRTFL
jgi:uncharacterized protein